MTLSIDLPKDLQSTFIAIAQEKNITQDLLAKEAIIEWIQDFKDAQDADKAHRDFIQNGEIFLASEVYGDLGLK
ncbi:hypothetical protein ACWIUD_02155 [Helicobacter sp. 23-1044]